MWFEDSSGVEDSTPHRRGVESGVTPRQVLPMLSDADNALRRCGAAEALHRIVQRMAMAGHQPSTERKGNTFEDFTDFGSRRGQNLALTVL